ncbi:Rv3654c family TadE-like protein [Corynebacterium gerontici]|uniref:Uncharacterized protein n=1 Tax=Corynebacterium gerontici TaxID=2079234 RepID=A0A3G6J2I8_9CORY|nr:Rv3654c family TadE-like protein [Corynebacterium gerontici]AZA12275.1 hypothetical protein CGERO_09945 [Corynebacterium gerontici]
MKSKVIDEQGNATILAAGIAAALALVLGVLLLAASAVIHTHQAQVAADMAAVAGAYAEAEGRFGCPVATQVLEANQAQMLTCDSEGGDVQIQANIGGQVAAARAGQIQETAS